MGAEVGVAASADAGVSASGGAGSWTTVASSRAKKRLTRPSFAEAPALANFEAEAGRFFDDVEPRPERWASVLFG
ncbi:MAG: hypothetical protein U1F43_20835 [Myxococcota bacterium]